MRQYRSELRKPLVEKAELLWEIGAGYTRTAKATVQDISASGMGLLTDVSFAVGAKLQITAGNKTHSGVVRRCIRQGGQHILGVQFER